MPYYVYILSNEHNTTIYTGVTNDLIRRVYEHKHHHDLNSFSSKYHVNKLVYYEIFSQPKPAIYREKQIKGTNRKKKNQLISELNPEWKDLYSELV